MNIVTGRAWLKNTTSACHVCGNLEVPTGVYRYPDNSVHFLKSCSCGTEVDVLRSRNADFYYVSDQEQACGSGCGCQPQTLGENAKTASQLHTCTLVVEIEPECNMRCPTCFADSPFNPHPTNHLPLARLKSMIDKVLEKQDKIDMLQLSGGEPTKHPEIFEIVMWAQNHPKIDAVLINTNGSMLAREDFTERLASIARLDRLSIYMQYDGEAEAGQKELRLGDYRKMRERALANCAKHKILVVPVMTVSPDNVADCPSLIRLAQREQFVRHVTYQPECLLGRNDRSRLTEDPISVADIVMSLHDDGIMHKDAWLPLPCSDPNCGLVGFLVHVGGQWVPANLLLGEKFEELKPLISNRINITYDNTLDQCGCDEFDLRTYLQAFGLREADIMMVFIKPFQDARTWEQCRIESCCTHFLDWSGKLDSFCGHYAKKFGLTM